jgi:hypothetical protein
MRRKPIKVTAEQKIQFVRKHRELAVNAFGGLEVSQIELAKKARTELGYSVHTYYKDIAWTLQRSIKGAVI